MGPHIIVKTAFFTCSSGLFIEQAILFTEPCEERVGITHEMKGYQCLQVKYFWIFLFRESQKAWSDGDMIELA